MEMARPRRGEILPVPDDVEAECFKLAVKVLGAEAGYTGTTRYRTSLSRVLRAGITKDTGRARDYLGLGAGAHSCFD